MLSIFPQLLFLSPVSATLLRVVAGLMFAYLAYYHFKNRASVAQDIEPVVGVFSSVSVWVYIVVESAIAVSLIGGIYAQLGAMFGALSALKALVVKNRFPVVIPFPRSTLILLVATCVSLIFTGAGILAFDLPL